MKLVSETVLKSKARGIREIGAYLTLAPGQQIPELSDNERAVMKRGEVIFSTLCATCHGDTARGVEIAGMNGAMLAPPLAGSLTINGDSKGGIYVLLKGLQGEIAGKKYEGLMISMASNDDQWVSDVLSYVRNSFGNRGSFVSPAEVAKARKDTAGQIEPWTYAQLHALLPTVLSGNSLKVTANYNGGEAGRAIDGSLESRYTTGKFMAPGMWLQIELKEATPIIGLVLDSSNSPNDYPRGYQVSVSTNGATWSEPVATGKGSQALTEIRFPETAARFIRITQTGKADGNFWSIHELQVLGKTGEVELNAAKSKRGTAMPPFS
jgi:mono/diheme cytochrome c family protein